MSLEHALEIPAALASLLNAYLGARGNIWNWFFGVVTVTLYGVVFFQSKLYADMCLQGVYFVFQWYGWYQWRQGNGYSAPLKITRTQKKYYPVIAGLIILLTLICSFILSHDTDSTTPLSDAFTTAMSLLAQWMLCKKWIENWLLWMIVDLVSIYMYFCKHLYLTSVLYVVLFALCCLGYVLWQRLLHKTR